MKDEIWTKRDGTKIAVSDMDESHVRNALRMVIRNHRKLIEKRALARALVELMNEETMSWGGQDELHAEAMQRLRDPNVHFPLLGCNGSEELYNSRGRGR